MIRQARQMASVASDHALRRRGLEAVLAHHLLAVHAPALDELGRIHEQPRQGGRVQRGRELVVVARIRLVDAGVEMEAQLCSRMAPGSSSTDGVTM